MKFRIFHLRVTTRRNKKFDETRGKSWSRASPVRKIIRKRNLEARLVYLWGTALRNLSRRNSLLKRAEGREAVHMAERSNGGVGRKKNDEIISGCSWRVDRFSVRCCAQSVPVVRPIWRVLLNSSENGPRKERSVTPATRERNDRSRYVKYLYCTGRCAHLVRPLYGL